jgi:hypothetical protein
VGNEWVSVALLKTSPKLAVQLTADFAASADPLLEYIDAPHDGIPNNLESPMGSLRFAATHIQLYPPDTSVVGADSSFTDIGSLVVVKGDRLIGQLTGNFRVPTIEADVFQLRSATGSTFSRTSPAIDFFFTTPGLYRQGFDSLGGTVGYIRQNIVADAPTNTWGHVFSTSLLAMPNTFTHTLFVGASNRVGIGTTSPNAKLAVAGNITSTTLIGAGDAFVCADSSGQLFRKSTPCV